MCDAVKMWRTKINTQYVAPTQQVCTLESFRRCFNHTPCRTHRTVEIVARRGETQFGDFVGYIFTGYIFYNVVRNLCERIITYYVYQVTVYTLHNIQINQIFFLFFFFCKIGYSRTIWSEFLRCTFRDKIEIRKFRWIEYRNLYFESL